MSLSYFHSVSTTPYIYETAAEVFDKQYEKQPDQEAFIFYDEHLHRTSVTFREAYEQSLSLAAGMLKTFPDLKVGDRICIYTKNNCEYPLCMLAASRLGLVAALASAERQDAEKFLQLTQQTSCCGVIGDMSKLQNISVREALSVRDNWKVTVLSGTSGQALTDGNMDLESLMEIGNSCFNTRREVLMRQKKINPDTGAFIFFSSGSTGQPKATLFSHFQILNEVKCLLGEFGYLHTDSQMVESPLSHISGLLFGFLVNLCFGASSVSVPKSLTALGRQGSTYLRLINKEKCTFALVFGYSIFDIINEPANQELQLSCLRSFITGGHIISEENINKFIARFPDSKVVNVYGLAECMAATNTRGTDFLWIKIIGNLEVKIVNSNNELVPLNSPGVVCIRTGQMMTGYIVDGKIHNARDEGGWFRTDDTAMMNESGELCILGRVSEIIPRGPAKIFTVPLERILDSHPKILKSAIVPVPDPRLGSDICICVIPTDDKLTETDLLDWCADTFGSDGMGISLRPKCCAFFDRFPLTTSGKISKPDLKNMALDRLSKKIKL